ncbi:MAG: hypothetical protein ABIV11_08385 [Gemmatimonadaceae bacterium]
MHHSALAALLAVMVCAPAASGQQPQARIGIGTLITRDRGWNYHESIEFSGVSAIAIGPVDMEAGASLIRSFAEFGSPADFSGPVALRDGFTVRVHFRAPSASRSALSGLVGAEAVWDITDGNPKTNALATAIGVALDLGPSRRASLDLRYVAFAKRLGTSKGMLAATAGWRL